MSLLQTITQRLADAKGSNAARVARPTADIGGRLAEGFMTVR